MTRLFNNVPGAKITNKPVDIKQCLLDVRISNDHLGISLSICNLDDGIMYQVPISKSMLKELTRK